MNFSSGEGLRVIRTTDFSTEFQMTYIFQYLIDHGTATTCSSYIL